MASLCYNLVFERDNPCNTTIFNGETSEVLYEVITEHGEETVTRVQDANGKRVASWVWKEWSSDIITFGNREPRPVNAWLKKSYLPFKNTVALTDNTGRRLTWRGNGTGLSLELFFDGEKTEPLARFCKSRHIMNREPQPPTFSTEPARLVMDERAEEIQDIVVVSFLVLERGRRLKETSTLTRTGIPYPGGPA